LEVVVLLMLLLELPPGDVEEVDNFGRKEIEVLLVEDLLVGDEGIEVETVDAAAAAAAAAEAAAEAAADVVAVELDDDNIGVLMDDLILLIALESLEDVPLFGGDIERDACNKEVLEEVSLVFTCKDDCTGLE
jgi:methylmalonyl-CoA mutase cobalamin-binding subunit